MNSNENLHAGHRERTIEKFLENPQSFSDHEMLEVLLFYAMPRKNTNDVAHRLLRAFGSIENVFEADKFALKSVDGVGDKIATEIILVGKIAQRIFKKKNAPVRLTTFGELNDYVLNSFDGEKSVEKSYIILLSRDFKILTKIDFCDNLKASVSMEIPEFVSAIAIHKPQYVIMAHNHLSGNSMPSEEDDLTTMRINLLCGTHGVKLFDHLIVGKNIFSYRDSGRLERLASKSDIHKILRDIKER